jgi:hypothetical protein
MRALTFLLILSVLAGAVGCKTAEQPKVVKLVPQAASSQTTPAGAPQDDLEAFFSGASVAESSNTKFFSAAEAPNCPEISVTTVQGKEISLGPGKRGFAEPGCVTLIVFWDEERAHGPVAARHVSDLVHKYAKWRVRGVGIVEKTAHADRSLTYASGLAFDLYYDDLSALKEMSSEAGAEVTTAVPSIFIVDRKMRLRFYRAGFRFNMGGIRKDPRTQTVMESAPAKQTIEDYLKTILNEG